MKPKNCKRVGIHSLMLATAAAVSLAVSFNTVAAPDEKAAGKAPPPPPPKTAPSKTTAAEPKGGGVAKGAATGVAATPLQLCSNGFTKIDERRHASHNGIEQYSCSAPIPACLAQKQAAANAAGNPLPSRLQGVTKKATGGAVGTMEGSHSFKIETKYEVGYDYSCDVIASCIAPALNNNANGHSEAVTWLGNNVIYRCTYFWVQG